ncbi:Fic family protein [Verrucomicrobia bacterium LW23]|nr:Fic family protein [Verrucomicrobia bacterium LW23]
MKIPPTPPTIEEIESNLAPERFFKLIVSSRQAEYAEKPMQYMSWDVLRRKIPPEGLTANEWWLLHKFPRRIKYEKLPLSDKNGNPFRYFMVPWFLEAVHKIDLKAGGNISSPELAVSRQSRDQYIITSLVEEAITSSQLEGAATTREVARDMLQSGRKPRDISEKMILNNFLTMQEIVKIKDKELTPELVFHIHRLVTRDTMDDPSASGRLRLPAERRAVMDMDGTIFHEPPAAEDLAERLKAMCEFANARTPQSFIHPLIRAIILHFWLAYDHPFVDGNGRTARALFYWSMLRSEYWLFEYISISQVLNKAPAKYAISFLHTETDDNDLNHFIAAQLLVMDRALEELHKYVARKSSEIQLIQSKFLALNLFNHRQEAVLQSALKNPGSRFTIEAHKISYRVSYQTARTDLLTLADKGLLRKLKRDKEFVFVAPKNLDDRLMTLSQALEQEQDEERSQESGG